MTHPSRLAAAPPPPALIAAFLLSDHSGAAGRRDQRAQTLPYTQAWSNAGHITADDSWTGVPGIVGYRGDDLVAAPGSTRRRSPSRAQSSTSTRTRPIRASFDARAAWPSSTARRPGRRAPGLRHGRRAVPHAVPRHDRADQHPPGYVLRDVDGSADNAFQPVALQYRVGRTGLYTNLPAGFVADATSGPSLATLVTPVSVTLPRGREQAALVEIRMITTDAAVRRMDRHRRHLGDRHAARTAPAVQHHADRWRDRRGARCEPAGHVQRAGRRRGFVVHVSCARAAPIRRRSVAARPTFNLDPRPTSPGARLHPDGRRAQVTDQDTDDPPDAMASDVVVGFTHGRAARRCADRDVHDPGRWRGRCRRRLEPACRSASRSTWLTGGSGSRVTRAGRTPWPWPVGRRRSRSIRPPTSRLRGLQPDHPRAPRHGPGHGRPAGRDGG